MRQLFFLLVVGFSVFATSAPFAGSYEDGAVALKSGDYATALQIWKPLAEKGDVRAQIYVGRMYQHGWGVARNYKEAVNWYQLAVKQGDELAEKMLAWMFDSGSSAFADGDYVTALRIWKPLAEKGYPKAQDSLAGMYKEGLGVAQDHKKALKWYRLAAEQGYAGGQYGLALMYRQGVGVPQSYVHAHMWFNVAAVSGGGVFGKIMRVERQAISEKMTAAQIERAQEMAIKCQESNYEDCD